MSMSEKSSRNQEKDRLFAERYGGSFYFHGVIDPKKIISAFNRLTNKFFSLDKVYTQAEMEATLKVLPKVDPHDLENGDCVYLFVTRQDYRRVVNKNHGWVIVWANIKFDGWEKDLIPWKCELERWEKPIGRERFEQRVDQCWPQPRCKYILAKIGIVQYYPEKGGKTRGKR